MINRRIFLCGITLGTLAAPLNSEAQQAGNVPRIGVLVPVEPASPTEPNLAAFRRGLSDLGYVDGQNIVVEYRHALGQDKAYAEQAAEFVRLKVDVLVVGSGVPTRVAKNATQTIPIVGVAMGTDPVRTGLVASLARPGGNVTGSAYMTGGEFLGKMVELLKEAPPRIARVGFLHEERGPGATYLTDLEAATRALGLTLQDLRVREINEIEGAFGAMSKEQGGSIIVPGDLLLMRHASQVTRLATKHRLPGIYGTRVFMDAGGLMFYGPSLADLWRRAAIYVDKILKGSKPGDLPVEQPTKFELVINLKTAKALGLKIPQSLLLRADQVIE